MTNDENKIWAKNMQELLLKLLDHPVVACDVIPRFSEDFVGSNLDHFLMKNYITREEYDEIWNSDKYIYNPELRGVRITKLIIKYRDKPDVVDDLYCYIEASVAVMKEYIRKKYPENFRELFNSNPDYSDLSPKDLKKLHRFMKRHFNIIFEDEKNSG